MGFEQAGVHQVGQQGGRVGGGGGAQLAQLFQAELAFLLGQHQGEARGLGLVGKARAELLGEGVHCGGRHQAVHAQFQQGLLGFDLFVELGCAPLLGGPVLVDAQQARARVVAIAHQLEHGLEAPVAAVAIAPLNGQGGRNPHPARVAKAEHVGPLDHQHRGPTAKVCVDQRVGQGFPQGFMHGGVIHPLPALELERDFQIRSELLVNLAEKIVYVARPAAIGHQPINPAPFGAGGGAFLVVQHVMGQRVADHFAPAKHQQTRQTQPAVTLFAVLAKGADPLQKGLQGQIRPGVAGFDCRKAVAIGGHRVHVQIAEIKALEHPVVPGAFDLLGQQAAHGFIVGGGVAPRAAQIGAAKRVAAHMHRALLAAGAGHPDAQHALALQGQGAHIAFGQQVVADLGPVVQPVPQGRAQPFGFGQPGGLQPAIGQALSAQQDHPAVGIGQRAIGAPEVFGQPVMGGLAFQLGGFAQLGEDGGIAGGVHGVFPCMGYAVAAWAAYRYP